jgi:hypothetical protein
MYTARSLQWSPLTLAQEASPIARTATPLSDVSRSPETITHAEACYLPQGRIAHFEHSLTHWQEKCDATRAERTKHSPSDL